MVYIKNGHFVVFKARDKINNRVTIYLATKEVEEMEKVLADFLNNEHFPGKHKYPRHCPDCGCKLREGKP